MPNNESNRPTMRKKTISDIRDLASDLIPVAFFFFWLWALFQMASTIGNSFCGTVTDGGAESSVSLLLLFAVVGDFGLSFFIGWSLKRFWKGS